jgi:concanavalin A-like lectin/glucanase superfamily protein/Big-like domain-containing protein
VPNGTHVMTIVARDAAGNETSAPCEWNVQNPTVTVPFTSPADGATVSGTVNLAAHVLTDGQTPNWTGWLPVGNPVTGVAFEVVGGPSQFDSTAPYAFAWDSTTVPNGTYTVRARVQWMDYSQARATNEIQVTVDNPLPLPAPTGVAPSVTDDDVTLSWNAVAGATRYRVQRNGSDVGTTTATSYTDANVPVGTHQYRVIAEDGTRTSDPSGAVSATIAPPPPSGLVAAYGFGELSGASASDSSGKGSTGTVSGATWAAGGRFGRALEFDGVNDLVTVPDSSLLDLAPGMTLEAWVKPTTVSDWRTVLLKERPGQLAYALYASGDNGRPLAEVTAATQRDARGTAALPVGVWTHLAATYDKSTLRLYVNGAQVSSTAVTGTLLNASGALRIGGNTVWGEYFSGLIDEVRVYERALSAAEIAADKDRAV